MQLLGLGRGGAKVLYLKVPYGVLKYFKVRYINIRHTLRFSEVKLLSIGTRN